MFCSTGRDGAYDFSRRDGTAYSFFHDGKGRYFFVSTARAVHFCFHDGTGRYAYLFTAAQEGAMKNTLLSVPRQQCCKLKLYVVHIILSYIRTLSTGTNLKFVICIHK